MMGEKQDDSHQSVNDDEKDTDELAASPGALSDSSSGQDDAILNTSDRRILSAQHNLKADGFFAKVQKVILYLPMRILSLFGISRWQNNLQVSGNAKIDKSPLRPASTSPQKRKREELEGSPTEMDDDEEEDGDMVKILENAVEGYESEEDKDFKPEDESSCSEEYTEGETEAELSKLSMEDVSEPRSSHYRNITEIDHDDKDSAEKTPVPDAPQKRKEEELEGSPTELDDDEEDGDMVKILENAVEGYESEEDKDFKPEDESSCSEEYTEGETETELSKLSIEDVSEPRSSHYRNIAEIDNHDDKDSKEKTLVPDAVPMPTKCIDERVSKPKLTPATVGVVG